MLKFLAGLALLLLVAGDAAAEFSGPNAVRSCRISTTRDLTLATGTQALTGCGFRPTSCIGTGAVTGQAFYTTYLGMVDSALNQFILGISASAQIGTSAAAFLVFADTTGANSQIGTVQSLDSGGLTISWAKNGSPTGTASFGVLCFR